jgi:predicted kinase
MPKRNPSPKLILVCGLPGSGKTTYARRLEAGLGAIRFCPDEWMQTLALDLYDEDRRAPYRCILVALGAAGNPIESLQWQLGQDLLAQGVTIIIEWGTWARSERDTLRLGAQALRASVELHYLSAPHDLLLERIQRRAMENPPITRQDLLHWSELFQAPTAEEIALFDNYTAVEPADD